MLIAASSGGDAEQIRADYVVRVRICAAWSPSSIVLSGCARSPDVRYREGRLLLKQGKLAEAMREADAGMRAEPSWRFRILKADILVSRSDAKAARGTTGGLTGFAIEESLARLRMDQGWLEYLSSNYSNAEALLQEATRIASPLNLPLLDVVIENRMGQVWSRLD